jgi:hypothetical protein
MEWLATQRGDQVVAHFASIRKRHVERTVNFGSIGHGAPPVPACTVRPPRRAGAISLMPHECDDRKPPTLRNCVIPGRDTFALG